VLSAQMILTGKFNAPSRDRHYPTTAAKPLFYMHQQPPFDIIGPGRARPLSCCAGSGDLR